jgi:hypothetical protein
MVEHYYFSQGGKEFGPFSAAELRKLAAAGRIQPADSVWREGTEQRVPAARVKNLFAAPPPPTRPPGTSATPPDARPPERAQAAAAAPTVPDPPPEPQTTAPVAAEASGEPAPQEEPAEARPGDAAEASGTEAPVPGHPPGAAPPASARSALDASRRGPEPPARPKRVVGIRGGVLTGQDGVKAQFRKKCETCGWEDTSRTSTIIRPGASRLPFFCPKCRRGRTVEITAVI